MTVRELINFLLNFDADEEIEFYVDRQACRVYQFGTDCSLPYIEFIEVRED